MDKLRPISLYNYVYKLTTKVLGNQFRGILSTNISQQFTFLECRHIHDAIGIAHEVLHFTKSKQVPLVAFIIRYLVNLVQVLFEQWYILMILKNDIPKCGKTSNIFCNKIFFKRIKNYD